MDQPHANVQTGTKRRRQRDSDPEHAEGPLRTHFKKDPDDIYRPSSPGADDNVKYSSETERIKIKPDPDAIREPGGGSPVAGIKTDPDAVEYSINKQGDETTEMPGIAESAEYSTKEDSIPPASFEGVLFTSEVDYPPAGTPSTKESGLDESEQQSPSQASKQNIERTSEARSTVEKMGTTEYPISDEVEIIVGNKKNPIFVDLEVVENSEVVENEETELKPDPEDTLAKGTECNENSDGPGSFDAEGRPLVLNFFEFATKSLPKIEPIVKIESGLQPPTAPQVPHYTIHSEAEERAYVQAGPTQPIIYADAAKDENEEYMEGNARTLPDVDGQRYFKRTFDKSKQYNFDVYKYNLQHLAVYRHKQNIIEAVLQNGVVVVEGFTGCGKTTQVPQFILDNCIAKKEPCRIAVTQPRKLATITVANRVCDERGWEIGNVVGYQVGLEKRSGRDTLVTYMTTGVLLQKLIQARSLTEYSHIIIDEVHERDLETDFLLLVIKKILMEDKTGQQRRVKLILMSATLNADKFSKYFSIQRGMDADVEAAPIVKIPLSQSKYEVEEIFLDDLMDEGELNELEFSREKALLHGAMYDTAVKVIVELDNIDKLDTPAFRDPRLKSSNYVHLKPENRGSVLVFLPGYMEIDTLIKRLQEENKSYLKNSGNPDPHQWNIIPLHSSITVEEQNRAFDSVKPYYRKIIVSTNIAESSITVPDVVYVIDFCLTKSLDTDPRTNFSCLRTVWASVSQCIQRKGRTGRVAKGKVYRLVPKAFYGELDQETKPEMLRAGLENVVVRVKSLEMGSPKDVLALAVDAPLLSGIERAVVNLKELGGLTIFLEINPRESVYDTCDGDLTFLGKLMSKLPVAHQCARLIMLGHAMGVLKECIIIAAGLSVKSPFNAPFNKKLDAYQEKQRWANKSYSDCLAILHLYLEWSTTYDHYGGGRDAENEERRWARQAFAQLSALREIRDLVRDLNKRLKDMDIVPCNVLPTNENSVELTKEQLAMLKVAIAGAFYPNYFHRRRPENGYERERLREICGGNLFSTVYFTGFPNGHNGTLYAKHIADKLADGSDIPKVTFEGQKVLVAFESSSEKLGPVSQSVYRAVKLRQIRSKVEFSALWKEQEASYLANAQRLIQESGQSYIHCPPQINLPPINTEEFHVFVTHVENPGQFWVVYACHKAKLDEMDSTINNPPNQTRVPLTREEVSPGALCLAPYSEGGLKTYYRGRIRSENLGSALVYFVDFGNSKWIPVKELCSFNPSHIRQNLHRRPCLAVECRLAGIKPATMYGSVWHDTATRHFTAFSRKYTTKMKIYCIVKSVIYGTLYVIDPSGPGRVLNVNQKLLSEEFADEVEENFMCRLKNNARQRISLMDPDEIQSHNQDQLEPMTDITYIFPPSRAQARIRVELKGPRSPLELEFQSLCHSSSCKQVNIDDNSVNSVALDHEPSALTSRLVVASSVSIQDKSGRVVARDTTMLPAIPGVMGLVSMIFAPKIELRVDRAQSRYTGVLCGLGMDPDFKAAIYQDHDMEIVFDTAIDDDDIAKINRIRFNLNVILRGDQAANLLPFHVSLTQGMFELLKNKKRKPVEEVWPLESYSWNQIPRASIIPPTPSLCPTERLDIFLPHASIALQHAHVPNVSWGDHPV